MKATRRLLLIACIAPLVSWIYFRFVHFPVEVERHSHGPYTIVAFAEPTDFSWHPAALIFEVEVMFGSIHNYTQIHIELLKDGRKTDSVILVRGEDLPGDHLPLTIRWTDTVVAITEPKRGNTAEMRLQPAGPTKAR
jgi:hypothetical protein